MTQFIDDSVNVDPICGGDGCGSVDAEMPFYLYLVLALKVVALLLLIWTVVKLLRKKIPREQRRLELKWAIGLLIFIPLGVLWLVGIDMLWLLGLSFYYFWKKQKKGLLGLLLVFLIPLTLVATSGVVITNLVDLERSHYENVAEESFLDYIHPNGSYGNGDDGSGPLEYFPSAEQGPSIEELNELVFDQADSQWEWVETDEGESSNRYYYKHWSEDLELKITIDEDPSYNVHYYFTYPSEESIFYRIKKYKIDTGDKPGDCIKLFYSGMEHYGPDDECKYSILY